MLLKILGSQKRLEILKLLSREDKYVSEIMELAAMDGKNAAHHLTVLEDAGIVRSYREGRRKYYHLEKEVRLEVVPPPEGKFLIYTAEGEDRSTS